MKHTKSTLTLLLSAVMLSSCLLPMASCTGKSTLPDSPFNDTLPPEADKDGESGQPNTDIDSGWTQGTSTGEKRLYGKQNLYEPRTLKIGERFSTVLRYGDMMISGTNYSNTMGYFAIDEPQNARLLCFDPLCPHWPGQESCPAIINYYMDWEWGCDRDEWYIPPMGWYIDYYESTEAPVVYLYYRRSGSYTVGFEELAYRDPVYCIERYDMAQGKRYTVLDGVEDTIAQACNYGDSIYYVLDMGEETGKEIHCLHKSGKETAKLALDKKTESVRIVEVIDDMFYYMVDEQYLYRSALDLTESEMLLDLSTLKGKDDSIGLVQGSYSGYLYYIADAETVTTKYLGSDTSAEKANLYRIPMNELTKTPEMVVEGMNFGPDEYMFAEKTFYYTPCLLKAGERQPNYSDGKLMALNLITGESKTIVEDSGMNIYLKLAWDDMAVFSGTAYTNKGRINTGTEGGNLLMAYTSGEPFEIWTKSSLAFGILNEEYLEAIRAATKAAANQG